MALTAGPAAVGLPPVLGGPAVPQLPVAAIPNLPAAPASSFTDTGGAFAEACGAGGAWDLRSWERRQRESTDCLCVEIGGRLLFAAHWDGPKEAAVQVVLSKDGAHGLQSALHVSEHASAKRMQTWLSGGEDGPRARGQLPAGISCEGEQAVAAAVLQPTRLLELWPQFCDEGCLRSELLEKGRQCGGELVCRPTCGDGETELLLRLRLSDSKSLDLEPALALALLLAHARGCSEAPDRESEEPSSFTAAAFALAVPGSWPEAARASAAQAVEQAGLPLAGLQSTPLCIVAGLDDADALYAAMDDGHLILVLDSDSGSAEVSLLEGTAEPSGVRRWRLLVSAAEVAGHTQALAEAAHQILQEHLQGRELHGLVLRGDLEANGMQSVLAEAVGGLVRMEALQVRCAPPEAASRGLARLIAAEAELAGSPQVKCVGALPSAIGVARSFTPQDVEVLFERGTALPAEVIRRYERVDSCNSAGEDLNLKLVQRTPEGVWRPCFSLLEVLTALDERGKPVMCRTATVAFRLDAGGLLTASVEEVSGLSRQQDVCQRWWRPLLILLLLLGIGGGVLYSRMDSERRANFQSRLEQYMAANNPDKLRDIPKWLKDYAGKEDVLIRRLEKKYKARFPKEDL